MSVDYAAALTAVQAVELRAVRRYRAWQAEELRSEADGYDLRALTADPSDVKELEYIAFGLRIAAAKVDPA